MLTRLALALPLALSSLAFAAPPTTEQIDAFVKKVSSAAGTERDAAVRKAAREAAIVDGLKEISFAEATFTQIERVARVTAGASDELSRALDSRLIELAKAPTLEGARAAELRLRVQPAGEAAGRAERHEALARLVIDVTKHPAAKDLFTSASGGSTVYSTAGSIPVPTWVSSGLADAIISTFATGMNTSAISGMRSLLDPLANGRDAIGSEKAETIRLKIVAASEEGIDKAVASEKEAATALKDAEAAADADDAPDDAAAKVRAAKSKSTAAANLARSLKDLRKSADTKWARGELINRAAPEIAFNWSSTDKPLKSFEDLKGKVVLVDFWATWCGPCVAAFPKIRELQARYAGYPVVILGVTSEQGARAMERKLNEDGKRVAKAVDCSGDPAKEHALMTEFMKDMEMTWPVVFSDKSCFNPDFGVRGIPHLAIIDSTGKVRFNGLRPNAKEGADHIDALLKEAKLPYPEQPYVEPKKEDAKPAAPTKG